ncbi:hypothetical protein NM688_g8758 [Phlebia brevispora]|uniref:Uncharacterized protein n=1 Tax=Phlebia brevispora TaxID=194682 RepID=A0ACC1RPI6_9APHY|nr:hypothetical protein NM688_g8758 [Phlebia brevispora]
MHGVRTDKRPDKTKAEEELGERISLTFRHIGTYLTADQSRIWGQGARGKTKDDARPVVVGGEDALKLIVAFGEENHRSDFDWDANYGEGTRHASSYLEAWRSSAQQSILPPYIAVCPSEAPSTLPLNQSTSTTTMSADTPIVPADTTAVPAPDAKTAAVSLFDHPMADVIIRSSDGVEFRVFKIDLIRGSPMFKDMFSLTQPPPTDNPEDYKDGLPVISLSETSEVLSILLRCCMPGTPKIEPLGGIAALVEAGRKYDVEALWEICEKTLMQMAEQKPAQTYALAVLCDFEAVVKQAALYCLRLPMPDLLETHIDQLDLVTGQAFRRLLKYRYQCSKAALDYVSSWSKMGSPENYWENMCSRCSPLVPRTDRAGSIRHIHTWWDQYLTKITGDLERCAWDGMVNVEEAQKFFIEGLPLSACTGHYRTVVAAQLTAFLTKVRSDLATSIGEITLEQGGFIDKEETLYPAFLYIYQPLLAPKPFSSLLANHILPSWIERKRTEDCQFKAYLPLTFAIRDIANLPPALDCASMATERLMIRHIGTYLTMDRSRIWGQGAKGKTKDDARPVVAGGGDTLKLIAAFGEENHRSDFDWDVNYGEGFDVLHIAPDRSSDGVESRVFKIDLIRASPMFEDMLSLTQRPPTDNPGDYKDGLAVITLSEPSKLLSVLLRCCMPGNFAEVISDVVALAEAGRKYDVEMVLRACQSGLSQIVETEPVKTYALACMCGFEAVARQAALYSLRLPQPELLKIHVDELDRLPAQCFRRLLKYCYECSEAALDYVDSWSTMGAPGKFWEHNCSQCATKIVYRTDRAGGKRAIHSWWNRYLNMLARDLRLCAWEGVVRVEDAQQFFIEGLKLGVCNKEYAHPGIVANELRVFLSKVRSDVANKIKEVSIVRVFIPVVAIVTPSGDTQTLQTKRNSMYRLLIYISIIAYIAGGRFAKSLIRTMGSRDTAKSPTPRHESSSLESYDDLLTSDHHLHHISYPRGSVLARNAARILGKPWTHVRRVLSSGVPVPSMMRAPTSSYSRVTG